MRLCTLAYDYKVRSKSKFLKHTAVDDQTKAFPIIPLAGFSNLAGQSL
jgi:hypothetical protein